MIHLDIICSKVSLLEELNAVEIYWKGFASTDNYQITLNAAYEVIETYKTPFWISDMVNARVVKAENQTWLKNVFIPKVFSLGILRRGAYIVSQDVFNQSYLKEVKNDLENNFETRFFIARENAIDWLTQ